MAVAWALTTIAECDGYSVVTPSGLAGWVEEAWVDPSETPAALALRLLNGRRGLLIAAEVQEVVHEHRLIRVHAGARFLELEPPHLGEGENGEEPLTASWRTTGRLVELPDPPGRLHEAVLSLHRPVVPARRTEVGERPVWEVLPLMCVGLALIACSIIGLDILIAYLVTGRPPY